MKFQYYFCPFFPRMVIWCSQAFAVYCTFYYYIMSLFHFEIATLTFLIIKQACHVHPSSVFPQACSTVYERVYWGCYNRVLHTGGLNKGNLLSHSSGSWKSKIKMLAGWFLLRAVREGSGPFLARR